MHSTEEALISFFEQVALKNMAILEKLKSEQRFELNTQRWQFTLPSLHSFLQNQDDEFSYIDYTAFRKILFNTPIHQIVKSHGAEINISDNQVKVDKSHYALVWNTEIKPLN